MGDFLGLFQWLPLANGGRQRQRFGLERRHKLLRSVETSCEASKRAAKLARLESADYQLFVDWRRLPQLREISEQSFVVVARGRWGGGGNEARGKGF